MTLTISFSNVLIRAYKKKGKQTISKVEESGSSISNDNIKAMTINKFDIKIIVLILNLDKLTIFFKSAIKLILKENKRYGIKRVKKLMSTKFLRLNIDLLEKEKPNKINKKQ